MPAPARVDRSSACGYTAFHLMSSGNRTAVAPPTPPGPKGSNGNGCCRVSGSQKGAALLRLFCCLLTARQNRETALFRERSRRLRVSTHFFPRLPMNRQHLSAAPPERSARLCTALLSARTQEPAVFPASSPPAATKPRNGLLPPRYFSPGRTVPPAPLSFRRMKADSSALPLPLICGTGRLGLSARGRIVFFFVCPHKKGEDSFPPCLRRSFP